MNRKIVLGLVTTAALLAGAGAASAQQPKVLLPVLAQGAAQAEAPNGDAATQTSSGAGDSTIEPAKPNVKKKSRFFGLPLLGLLAAGGGAGALAAGGGGASPASP